MFFADPYYDDFERAAATLGNSWLDSGINALSVLARFAIIVKRESLRPIGSARESMCEARLACHDGGRPAEALLVTSWHAADGAKTTRLRYASGLELLMDHTAVAAYLLRDGGPPSPSPCRAPDPNDPFAITNAGAPFPTHNRISRVTVVEDMISPGARRRVKRGT